MAGPKSFRVCFEAHRKDGRVWAVQVGNGRWRFTKDLLILTSVWTRYYGAEAKQPKAVMMGVGVVDFSPILTRIR